MICIYVGGEGREGVVRVEKGGVTCLLELSCMGLHAMTWRGFVTRSVLSDFGGVERREMEVGEDLFEVVIVIVCGGGHGIRCEAELGIDESAVVDQSSCGSK
ncbi:hypothetical protein LOK49_LG01G01195 [Camellia lanceoleosa]|uniref:Uncharacterized protein n=1 Tax=Camellia lanceoleosa TaxID=1840588 RepID=A0ACC0IY98_9ERIC|nr:hypothetical protein LOK49_LG01G01195 [Camellia lanceoleosa]